MRRGISGMGITFSASEELINYEGPLPVVIEEKIVMDEGIDSISCQYFDQKIFGPPCVQYTHGMEYAGCYCPCPTNETSEQCNMLKQK